MAAEQGPKQLATEWVKSEHPEIDPSKINRVRAVFKGQDGQLTTYVFTRSETGVEMSMAKGESIQETRETVLQPVTQPVRRNVTFPKSMLESRPKLTGKEVVDRVVETTDWLVRNIHLDELDRWMRVKKDIMGLKRSVEIKIEANIPAGVEPYLPPRLRGYLESLREEEEKTGKPESACYGYANMGGVEVVAYVKYYDFRRGSNGQVAGEKFKKASELARRRNLWDRLLGRHARPLVCFLASAGARQDEGTVALVQLPKEVMEVHDFKEQTGDRPYITAIIGPEFGGESASIANGDITVALEGNDFGFSGKNLIEFYTKVPVEGWEQSVEAQTLTREIDLVFKTKEELLKYLQRFVRITKPNHQRLTHENKPDFRPTEGGETKADAFKLEGFISPDKVFYEQPREAKPEIPAGESEADRLLREYDELIRNSQRPDMQTLIARMFPNPNDVVNLYQGHIEHTEIYPEDGGAPYETTILRYPAIVASIVKLGPQPVLIIGNMPSYQRIPNPEKPGGFEIVKIPASPKPEDYQRIIRLLKVGDRFKWPLVSLIDTLGANPTIEAERRGQPRSIAESTEAINSYKWGGLGYICGVGGSGGMIGILPFGEFIGAFKKSKIFVAEARNQTAILKRVSNPSAEQVKEFLPSMKSTATEQQGLDIGIVNEVLPESDDPNMMASILRDSIIKQIIRLQRMPMKKRLEMKRKAIAELGNPKSKPTKEKRRPSKLLAEIIKEILGSK
jgi:acetyl-CoA carboxylase carboxyl transferase subunit beta